MQLFELKNIDTVLEKCKSIALKCISLCEQTAKEELGASNIFFHHLFMIVNDVCADFSIINDDCQESNEYNSNKEDLDNITNRFSEYRRTNIYRIMFILEQFNDSNIFNNSSVSDLHDECINLIDKMNECFIDVHFISEQHEMVFYEPD